MAADEKATFAIELQDETSGAAESAAKALESLKAKIAEGKTALAEMQAAQRNLKGGAGAAAEAQKELADKIAAQKATIAAVQAQYLQLGGTFGATAPKAQSFSETLTHALRSAKGLPGPLGSIGGMLAGLGGPAGMAAAAIGALAGAMAALVAAAAAATLALLKYGVAQANARRNELLRLEGFAAMPRLFGFVRASATEMQAALDRASASTSLGRGELATYAQQLARMGLRGDALSTSLDAIGVAATAAGERGAAFARAMLVSAARTGRSVDDVAERLRGRFGPLARRVMLDWNVQISKVRENLERLFSGLRLEQFLVGLQGVLSVFSQTTVTGRALKAIVESLFQPLIDFAAGPVMLHVKRFFQGMVLGALLVERQILRLRIWLRDTFGPGSIFDGLDTEMLAFRAGAAAVGLFVGAVVLAAAGLVAIGGAMAAVIGVLQGPFVMLFGLAAAVGAAVVAAFRAIVSMDWIALGRSIVDGLISGLRSGASRITSAVTGLGDRVRNTFRDVLQIRSPSRVFAELGEQIPAGVRLGIETGASEATSAASELVQPPSGIVGGARGSSISIGEVHIHASTSDPREHARSFVDELAEILEGTAITMGAA